MTDYTEENLKIVVTFLATTPPVSLPKIVREIVGDGDDAARRALDLAEVRDTSEKQRNPGNSKAGS